MNFQNSNNNSFIIENKTRLLFFIVLFLLSTLGMFGQTTTVAPAIVLPEVNNSFEEVTSVDSQIEFVSWFMGTKQSQIMGSDLDKNPNKGINKKQMIQSGVTPNRVLYRSFMKKVNNQNNAIV